MDRRLIRFRWSCPVAHVVGDFPRELVGAVTCPPADFGQPGFLPHPSSYPRTEGQHDRQWGPPYGAAGGGGPAIDSPPADSGGGLSFAALGPPVHWDFAPYIFEPRSQNLYRIARHACLGQVGGGGGVTCTG